MLQQVIYEVKEIQRVSEQKKVKTVPAVDSSGNIVYRAMHRSTFHRIVARPNYEAYRSPRFYFDDVKDFRKSLRALNASKKTNVYYKCVGYANAKLRFCCRCYDTDKELALDLYFVNREARTNSSNVLCLGCLGVYLKDFERGKGDIKKPKRKDEETQDSGNETK